MKFGKQIQAQQVPGWSAYYLDYKFLKKIISSLTSNRPASEAASLAIGVRPSLTLADNDTMRVSDAESAEASPAQPPIFSTEHDNDRGPGFQAHKAAFFFKLERELEKINAFYLQKEAELQLRLETLLSKRRAAVTRSLPDNALSEGSGEDAPTNVEWSAVEEGFRLLERDLNKLQQFVEINATGFRKILKKYDKQSKSTTKELYLARQVDVQPVFNRQLISEFSDTVAACLLDLTDLSSGLKFEGRSAYDVFTQEIISERMPHMAPFHELEKNLRKAVNSSDTALIQECVRYAESLAQQQSGQANVTRIFWNVILETPQPLADLMFGMLTSPFDFGYVDDINGRTCLHIAAIAGYPSYVDLCISKGVPVNKADAYGRSALHYASMNGYATICSQLLRAGATLDLLDLDNYSPLVYATMKGDADCVRVLIEARAASADTGPSPGADDLPLALACQSGHVNIVTLLIHYGFPCLPDTNGEYPIHKAAKAGHVDVCRTLLHREGWDTADKYHSWTPLFHAARYGHTNCVKLLIDAGAQTQSKDEHGHLALHYAAWYGHNDCIEVLLQHVERPTPSGITNGDGPHSDVKMEDVNDIDLIPSLTLPPPIMMPYRTYGHNYLDRMHLIQVTIGRPSVGGKGVGGVNLPHRLLTPASKEDHVLASTPLKLVTRIKGKSDSAPHTTALPQREKLDTFSFQIPSSSIDGCSLEFSVYPNFGTKTIGRAVASSLLLLGSEDYRSYTLPILDARLHVIGDITFSIQIISPFEGVTLAVGRDVETYWKSTTVSQTNWDIPSVPATSPVASPATMINTSTSALSAITLSSIQGDFVYAVVQLTRDLHPVVYSEWFLPDTGFDLVVADVTLAQFEALSARTGRNVLWRDNKIALSQCMLSLGQVMENLDQNFGLQLDLAFPSSTVRERLKMNRGVDLNTFVDTILRTTNTSTKTPRKIVFTSFCPDVCAALNWKQPNYPVFLSSFLGRPSNNAPSATAKSTGENGEWRTSNLSSMVEYARMNNLLGIFVDVDILIQVPSLIQVIKDTGLLVGVFAGSSNTPSDMSIEAILSKDGNVTFTAS